MNSTEYVSAPLNPEQPVRWVTVWTGDMGTTLAAVRCRVAGPGRGVQGVGALIELAQHHRPEVELEAAVGERPQPHRLAGERLAQIEPVVSAAQLAVLAHAAHVVGVGIGRLREPAGKRARRGRVVAVRWRLAERFVRAVVVVGGTERLEDPL